MVKAFFGYTHYNCGLYYIILYIYIYTHTHTHTHIYIYVWKGLLTVKIKIPRALFTQRRRQPLDIKVHTQYAPVWKFVTQAYGYD